MQPKSLPFKIACGPVSWMRDLTCAGGGAGAASGEVPGHAHRGRGDGGQYLRHRGAVIFMGWLIYERVRFMEIHPSIQQHIHSFIHSYRAWIEICIRKERFIQSKEEGRGARGQPAWAHRREARGRLRPGAGGRAARHSGTLMCRRSPSASIHTHARARARARTRTRTHKLEDPQAGGSGAPLQHLLSGGHT
jgi:hypothetical protein